MYLNSWLSCYIAVLPARFLNASEKLVYQDVQAIFCFLFFWLAGSFSSPSPLYLFFSRHLLSLLTSSMIQLFVWPLVGKLNCTINPQHLLNWNALFSHILWYRTISPLTLCSRPVSRHAISSAGTLSPALFRTGLCPSQAITLSQLTAECSTA